LPAPVVSDCGQQQLVVSAAHLSVNSNLGIFVEWIIERSKK
jgi:hypothetical protein